METARQKKSGPRARRSQEPLTPLQVWLDTLGFTSAQLEAATGISRQTMTKIRGGSDVRFKTMLRILRGCRKLCGAKVPMDAIFDLDPDSLRNSIAP